MALIRSFQRKLSKDVISVRFADFAIAAIIFNEVFLMNVQRDDSPETQTRRDVDKIAKHNGGNAVSVDELSTDQKIGTHQASEKLRKAAAAGTIQKVNKTEKGNRKLYLPVQPPNMLPTPETVIRKLNLLVTQVEIVDPFRGSRRVYKKRPDTDK